MLPPEGPEADSRLIKTILALTNNPNRREEPYHIVSRIRDPKNLGVARMVGRAELELVAVDDLIARITAQTCRQSGLSAVFEELISPEDSELYLKLVSEYLDPGVSLTFYTFVEAARRRGEVAVGYCLQAEAGDPNTTYGVYLNPDKSRRTTFTDQDKLIVLAES